MNVVISLLLSIMYDPVLIMAYEKAYSLLNGVHLVTRADSLVFGT